MTCGVLCSEEYYYQDRPAPSKFWVSTGHALPRPLGSQLHMGLHSKLQQWLHRMAISLAPMDCLRGLIRGRVLRHMGHTQHGRGTAPHVSGTWGF